MEVTIESRAVEILSSICYGLEGDGILMPPELREWFVHYEMKKDESPEVILE